MPYIPCSQGCYPYSKPIAPRPESFSQCVPMAMLIMRTAIGHMKENPKGEHEEEQAEEQVDK